MVFQIVALIIMAVFYGCYFLKMLSQRKKGIQTDQIGKGKKGIAGFIELTMKYATILTPAAEVVSICLNTTYMPPWARLVGSVIGVLGAVVFICSVITMRDSWRAGVSETDKTEFITSGIYQISRNPAFLGFDLVYVGILIMFFNRILLVITMFAIFMFHLQIVIVEEKFLAKTFGNEYLNYRKKVNRYIGRKP
ncbi:MAG: methyltransferase family protein [Clostridia bacterium]